MSTQWLVGTAGILAVAVGLGAETRNDTSPVAELGQGAASPTIVVRPGHLPTGRFSEQTAPNNAQATGALNAAVRRTCVTCRNDRMRRGGLSREDCRVEDAPRHLEEAEAMITKLRLDMMPPPGVPRPGRDTLLALAETLERTIDESAVLGAPGRRPVSYTHLTLPPSDLV